MDDDIDGDTWSNVSELICGTIHIMHSAYRLRTLTQMVCVMPSTWMMTAMGGRQYGRFPIGRPSMAGYRWRWEGRRNIQACVATFKQTVSKSKSEFDIPVGLLSAPHGISKARFSTREVFLRSGSSDELNIIDFVGNCHRGRAGRFAFKVDSESNYDFLNFTSTEPKWNLGQGILIGRITLYAFTRHPHSGWSYTKDVTVSNGLDAAWIDDIVLPTSLYMTNPEITDFGTHRDHDDDNDGVLDDSDHFPLDDTESSDWDGMDRGQFGLRR